MTIKTVLERAANEFSGIDGQIQALEAALKELETQRESWQGFSPEDAKKRATLRAEQEELRASLSQAMEVRQAQIETFSKEMVMPNMHLFESDWQQEM